MQNSAENEKQLSFSHFCYLYNQNEIVALFHALRVQVVYISSDNGILDYFFSKESFCLSELSGEEREIAIELFEAGLIISDNEDDSIILENIIEQQTGCPRIGILYLLLTEKCNLACKYCFIEGAIPVGYESTTMSLETAQAAVDLFAKFLHPDFRPSIIFYGGEPLLNWETLVHTVGYIEHLVKTGTLPENCEVSIISNATLLTDERIRFLAEHNINISISLDGPGENNNARVFHNHRKSIDRVMQAYHKLKEQDISFGISCTINSFNIDNIREVVQWFCDEDVSSVSFNILMDTSEYSANEELTQKSVYALTEAYEKLRAHGIYEDRIGRKVNSFTSQQLHLFDCGGYGGQLVIAPDGDVGVCHAYLGERKHFVANVYSKDFNPTHDPTFVEWSRRSPVNMPQCYDCPVLGICGGGCATNAEKQLGTIWALDERFCTHAKHTLEWMIWDLFEIASSQEEATANQNSDEGEE